MTWLLGLGEWLENALSALVDLTRRYPLQMALIASLCLSGWLWHGRSQARQELAALQEAQRQAAGAQKRVNDVAQQHYTEKAHEADDSHVAVRDDARAATDRYIADHRVRAEDRACQTPAPAPSDGTAVPSSVPSGVVVGEADVRTCGDLYAYAVSAHDWAQSLKLPENLLPGERPAPGGE